MMPNRLMANFLAILLLIPVIAAAVAVPLMAQPSQEQVIEVRVARGDTLGKICREYLADPKDWTEVARVNRLANSDVISPGQVLVIPVRLLKSAPSDGRADFVRGRVEIRLAGGPDWKSLAAGDRIPQGSFVRTGRGSALEITFENGDSCFLRPDTTLGLTTTASEGGGWVRKFFLELGRVITRIQKATGVHSRFEITTPSAQCAARGTVFRAGIDAEGTTRSEVLEGIVAVSAMGASVDVAEGQGTAVRKGERPLPPRPLLSAPAPGKIEAPFRRIPFSIPLAAPTGAVSVIAALTHDRDGKDTAVEAVLKPGDAFQADGIGDGSYFLQSRALDELGLEGLPSLPVEIAVRTRPYPPALLGMTAGAPLRNGPPRLHWIGVEGAAHYRVQLAADPGFARIIDQAEMSGLSWTSALSAVGEYHLRARSIAADGFEGDWSEDLRFFVLPPLVSPVLEKPRRSGGWVNLKWSEAGPGAFYRLQVARDKDFTALAYEANVVPPALRLAEPADSGLYYVRVKAADAAGAESAFSNPRTFRIGGFWAVVLSPCSLVPLATILYLLFK